MKDEFFKLPKEKREELTDYIKEYFYKERQEDLGDLGAGLILDFIIEKMGPTFYNQGVADAYKFIDDKLGDILELQKY